MPWQRDPYISGSQSSSAADVPLIENRDRAESQRVEVRAGQVDWEGPTARVHRAVNVGRQPYEQITVFLLDRPDAVPQPNES